MKESRSKGGIAVVEKEELNIEMANDKIAIEVEKESVSKGGIVLPDGSQRRSGRGTVVAVGPGAFSERHWKRIPHGIEVGQRVEYSEYRGQDVEIQDRKLSIISAGDVLFFLPAKSDDEE